MALKDPNVVKAKQVFDITLALFAMAAIVLSAVIILDAPEGTVTGFAIADADLLTGSEGSDDAAYYSFLVGQRGRIDEAVFRDYERFSVFQDFLNYVYATPDMGQMEMAPLEITEPEFSSGAFSERYLPMVYPFNRMVMSAAEVRQGNKAAEERFLAELYSFELYLEGLSSGAYWRAEELPSYEGLAEVREKYGKEVYQNVIANAYELLLLSDPNMPPFEEWV
jgi:hypothetical protein